MPTRAQVWISSWNSPSLLYILQSWIALFASCRFRTKFSRSDFHREGPVNSSTGPAATLIYTLPHIFFYRLVQDHKVSIILSQYKSGLNCDCTRGSTRFKGFYAVCTPKNSNRHFSMYISNSCQAFRFHMFIFTKQNKLSLSWTINMSVFVWMNHLSASVNGR